MDSFIIINKKSQLEQYINSIFEIHECLLKKNNYNEIKKLKQIYDIDKLIFYNLFKMKPNLNLSSIFIYEFIENFEKNMNKIIFKFINEMLDIPIFIIKSLKKNISLCINIEIYIKQFIFENITKKNKLNVFLMYALINNIIINKKKIFCYIYHIIHMFINLNQNIDFFNIKNLIVFEKYFLTKNEITNIFNGIFFDVRNPLIYIGGKYYSNSCFYYNTIHNIFTFKKIIDKEQKSGYGNNIILFNENKINHLNSKKNNLSLLLFFLISE